MQVRHQEELSSHTLSYSKATIPSKAPRAGLAKRPPVGQIQARDLFGLALDVFLKNVNQLPIFEIPDLT